MHYNSTHSLVNTVVQFLFWFDLEPNGPDLSDDSADEKVAKSLKPRQLQYIDVLIKFWAQVSPKGSST
jgi:hypothetical protein